MSDLTKLAATAADIPGLVIEIASGKRTRIVDGKVIESSEDRVTCFVGKDSLEFSNVSDALLAIKLHQMLGGGAVAGNDTRPVASAEPIVPPAHEAVAKTPDEEKPKPRRRKAPTAAAPSDSPPERPAPKKGLPGPPRPAVGTGSISLAEADRELARGEQIAPITVSAPATQSSFADRQSRHGGPKQTADPNRVRVAMGPTVI